MSDSSGYYGTQQPEHGGDEYNAIAFVVRSILNGRNFAALVRVVNVTAPGGVALSGTVDVQPLVNQLDGQGNAVPHGVVNDLPYMRAQGGANAIILDPQPGDIGIAIFCDRDCSSVVAARDVANPGSLRRSDMADGVYLGGLLNGAPTQYVMFGQTGITITTPASVIINSPNVELNGNLAVTENISAGNGASGTFTTDDGQTVVVQDGVITSIG